MKNWSKLAMTAGAIGVIGVAGSAGTFASFTSSAGSYTQEFKTGNVQVTGGFHLPDLSNMGTNDAKYAGSITVKNTGTKPINPYIDFDGPVEQGAAHGYPYSTNLLAENIIVDSSYDANFAAGTLMDDATRLWRLNQRDATPMSEGTDKLVLQPGQERTIYFRVHLRSRDHDGSEGNGSVGEGDGGADNEMENLSITETVNVKAIEAGGNDFGATVGSDNGTN
jgi:predicted ribosomally synthesized peptide with SipW-like signal peptide